MYIDVHGRSLYDCVISGDNYTGDIDIFLTQDSLVSSTSTDTVIFLSDSEYSGETIVLDSSDSSCFFYNMDNDDFSDEILTIGTQVPTEEEDSARSIEKVSDVPCQLSLSLHLALLIHFLTYLPTVYIRF